MSSAKTGTPVYHIEADALHPPIDAESKLPTVCLTGAPNAGKTALMNALTGGSFRTANYPGVTVTLSRGKSKVEFGRQALFVDLPGVHSTSASSHEEELSCQVSEGRHISVKPDALVIAVDATQLERHLRFASFVARQRKPTVIALTMMDLLPRIQRTINVRKLELAIGLRVVPVDGRTGWGAAELITAVNEVLAFPVTQKDALAELPEDPVAAYQEIRELLDNSEAIKNENLLCLRMTPSLLASTGLCCIAFSDFRSSSLFS